MRFLDINLSVLNNDISTAKEVGKQFVLLKSLHNKKAIIEF